MSDSAEVQFHRYPGERLTGDYLRSGVGILVGGGVLVLAPITWVSAIIFGGVGAIFVWLGARTAYQHMQKVAITPQGIFTRDVRDRAIAWEDLRAVKLRYYGTRGEHNRGEGGFLILTLKSGDQTLRLESRIEDFEAIARRVAEVAREQGVSIDPKTAGAMLDIGVDPDGESDPPARLKIN